MLVEMDAFQQNFIQMLAKLYEAQVMQAEARKMQAMASVYNNIRANGGTPDYAESAMRHFHKSYLAL